MLRGRLRCLCRGCLFVAVEKTMGPVAVAQIGAVGAALAAHRHGGRAAWMKPAPGGRVDKARWLASHIWGRCRVPGGLAMSHCIRVGRGRKQQLCIGMAWTLDHLF